MSDRVLDPMYDSPLYRTMLLDSVDADLDKFSRSSSTEPRKHLLPKAPAEQARRAVSAAMEEWKREIREPGPRDDPQEILKYFPATTLHYKTYWYKDANDRWRRHAWCGAFVAYFLVGQGLPTSTGKWLASTWKVYRLARLLGELPPHGVLPGDVVVMYRDGDKKRGSHIAFCVSRPKDGYIETVEGNARGALPTVEMGTRARGVVRQRRAVPGPGVDPWRGLDDPKEYRVIRVIRLAPEHFESQVLV